MSTSVLPQARLLAAGRNPSRRPALVRLAFVIWVAFCAVFVFRDTFGLPYAIDDLDHLDALAWMRNGDISVGRWLILNHNEHLVPVARALFWVSTWISGLDSWPYRVAVVAIHGAGAIVCGLVARRLTRSSLALFVTATAYAGAAGFAGSAVWALTVCSFSLATVLFTAALLVITRPHPGAASWSVCLALILAACVAMPGAIVASAGIALYALCRPPVSRRTVALSYTALICALGFAIRAALSFQGVIQHISLRPAGLVGGGWLILTAPFKFAAGWLPVPDPGVKIIAFLSVLCWVVLVVSSILLPRRARLAIGSIWAGAAVLAILTGAARSGASLTSLFITDRYYYLFLPALALQAGVLAARIPLRRYRPLAALFIGLSCVAALFGSRAKLRTAVPWELYATHQKAIASGQALAQMINAATASRTLRLAAGAVPFDGVHKDKIGLACLLFNQVPGSASRVRLTPEPIGPEAAALENRILDGWASSLGMASPVCVVDGQVQDVRPRILLDFRNGSFENAIVSGFHAWERTYRWMSKSGTVRLEAGRGDLLIRAHVPLDVLRRKWPNLPGIRVTVDIAGLPAGTIYLDRVEEQDFRIPVAAESLSPDAPVSVTLTSDVTWHPNEVLPTADERELSIAVTTIGFDQLRAVSMSCSERAAATGL